MTTFHLRKWYLDVVDAAGRSAIVYWSSLHWGPVALRWHAATLHAPGELVRHQSSLGAVPEPAVQAGKIAWRSEAIHCEVRCSPTLPAVEAELLPKSSPDPDFRPTASADATVVRERPAGSGSLTWRCEAPAGHTSLRLGAIEITGTGYAECLDLRCPPWRLPIDVLRWGRWISEDGGRSLVWIDWRGAEPLTRVYVDGLRAPLASVEDDEVVAGGERLTLRERRVLHERTLGDLLGGLGRFAPNLPRRWLSLEDRKWLSRGTRACAGARQGEGWVIHERIVFP